MTERQPVIERLDIEDPFAELHPEGFILKYGPQCHYPRAIVFEDERVGEIVNIVMAGVSLHENAKPGGVRAAPVSECEIKNTGELRPAIYFSTFTPVRELPKPSDIYPDALAEHSENFIAR